MLSAAFVRRESWRGGRGETYPQTLVTDAQKFIVSRSAACAKSRPRRGLLRRGLRLTLSSQRHQTNEYQESD